MQNPRLASRYAKSLLDLAVEQNSVDTTLQDMQLLDHVCTVSRDFVTMLRSPVINGDKKLSVINAVAGGKLSKITSAFINLLVAKGREQNLAEMAHAFIGQYKEMKNIKTVKLTTAGPIDDSVKKAILAKVAASQPNHTLDINATVNPELIGGFVLEMEDKLFDASVRRDLNDIKAQFMDNSYVAKV